MAILYSDQDQNTQAEKAYDEALEIRRTLAKTNPDVYQPDVAMTLNNLAILYSKQNQNTQAEEAYDEALEIRRTLVKTNADVYGIDLANTLVMGVDLFNKPKSNLDEARRLLERFEPTARIQELFSYIEQLK
ncbi:TPR repeat-containing protein [hydrothermal vent metagenome]|uniref:TPR repeat-containing protein n=1 Tax=hydrothermal vent metagenome TaxID=652676 RepID=A0A1W1E638_9ZZZZ